MSQAALPAALVEAMARYLIPRMTTDPQAVGLYNDIIVACRSQPETPAEPVKAPADLRKPRK